MSNGMEGDRPATPVPGNGETPPAKVTRSILRPRGRPFVVVAAVVAVLVIGALDYATGPGISLLLFYLVPIALADSSVVPLRKADALMYRAKSEGKNTVRPEVI